MPKAKTQMIFLFVFFILFLILFLFGNLKISLTASLTERKFDLLNENGFGGSIFVDMQKRPFISFINEKGELVLMEKENNFWKKEIVSQDGFFGAKTTIKENKKGEIFILYVNKNGILKLAVKKDGSWNFEDIFKGAFLYSSLFINKDDRLYVSFWVPKEGIFYGIKECDKWKVELVDGGEVGWWNSLSVDKNGRPHISYFDFKNKDLLYLFFNGKFWEKEIVDFEGDVGRWNSIFLDEKDEPWISYFDMTNGDLKVAKKENKGWLIEKVDTKGVVGERNNIIFSNDKKTPIISYVNGSDNSFRIAKKINNFWQIFIVEESFKITSKGIKGEIGGDNSIFIDNEGYLHLLWQNLFEKNLRYFKIKL